MPRGPIFIGGPDRCGKTLLAAIIGSHSRIAIPIVGSNLWTFFYRQYGNLGDDRNLDRCLAAMMSYKHARFLQPDLGRLRRELVAGERSYERLFALIHEQFAERAGKPRWGDQTGLIERYADEVLDAYPDAVMIHMIRDPRDRYEASLRLWPDGRARAGGAAARWGYSVRLAERNLRRHPDRYRIIRYEDLVQRTEEVVRDVTTFLEEEYEAEMLAMGDAPTYRRRLAGGVDPPAETVLISAEHVGDFRGAVTDGELAFLQRVLAEPMRRLGYAPEPLRMSTGARIGYAAWTLPSNVVRMAAWSALEAMQHRFPHLVGRTPIRAKIAQSEETRGG